MYQWNHVIVFDLSISPVCMIVLLVFSFKDQEGQTSVDLMDNFTHTSSLIHVMHVTYTNIQYSGSIFCK